MALELQLTTSNIPEYMIKGNKNYKIMSNYLGSPLRSLYDYDNTISFTI